LFWGKVRILFRRHSPERNLCLTTLVKINMSKNPFVNALAAMAYITVVASVLYYGSKAITPVDGVIIPISFLSLFVLSAALMGYFSLYQPIQLFLADRQKEATWLFLTTVAIFACITGAMVLILLHDSITI